MDKRHKDLLRRTVGDLRRTLAGGDDARGEWQRGDLDRDLERLGIAPDGARTPLSALPGLTDGDRRAHEAAVAAMADVPAERLAAARAKAGGNSDRSTDSHGARLSGVTMSGRLAGDQ